MRAAAIAALSRPTDGDATKGKQLSDLLFARTHAGEQRRLDGMAKAEAHRHQLHEAITLSLRDFVHAIHEAREERRGACTFTPAASCCAHRARECVAPVVARRCQRRAGGRALHSSLSHPRRALLPCPTQLTRRHSRALMLLQREGGGGI